MQIMPETEREILLECEESDQKLFLRQLATVAGVALLDPWHSLDTLASLLEGKQRQLYAMGMHRSLNIK